MDILSKIHTVKKISETEYGQNINSMIKRVVELAEEYDTLSAENKSDNDYLVDMVQYSDYALSDLQTRLQEYNIQTAIIRELQELFIASYRELYTQHYISAIEKKVKEFDAMLEKEKLKSPPNTGGSWSDKLTDVQFYKFLLKEGIKALRTFKDNLLLLASFIPVLNIKSEYRTRLESIFGTEAMRKLHDETHGIIIPLVTKRLEKQIHDEVEIYGAVFRNFEIPEASFISEDFSTSFKISCASAIMGFTSTIVLAAGWHTFAWSVMNLFLPMFFAIILPVFFLTVIGLQNYDIRKKQEGLEKAQRQINEYIALQMVPILVENSREKLKEISRKKEEEIFSYRFPGAHGLTPRDMNIAIMELSALIGKIIKISRKDINRSVIEAMRKRFESISSTGNTIAEALYAAVYMESLLEYINEKEKLGVNTLRDRGISAVVSKRKERQMLNEDQYILVTRARRIRNRLAHCFHEFEVMEVRFQREMLAVLKEACDILITRAMVMA